MSHLVRIHNAAISDIAQLTSYLRHRWGDASAQKAYMHLMDKLRMLENQPYMGSPVDELAQRGYRNYRLLVHDKHTKVLYRLDDDQKIIHIRMVFSSKQNFQALLRKRIIFPK